MKLFYKGVDIYPEISVSTCWHTMYSEGHADEILMRLNDTRALWDKWSPKKGDEIKIEDGKAKSGKMFVSEVTPSSGLITIRALSMPQKVRNKVSKSWENVKLSQLLQEVATNTGLTLEKHNVEDKTYKYVYRNNLTEFDFLSQRCKLEGLSFLVYDGKLVIYGQKEAEASAPGETLDISNAYDYQYIDESADIFTKCEVTDGTTKGEFTAPTEIKDSKTLHIVLPLTLTDESEAIRFSKNLLRDANKKMQTLTIWTDYMARNIAPGGTVTVKTDSAHSWDGVAFVEKVRHDYVHTTSKLWLRKGLAY